MSLDLEFDRDRFHPPSKEDMIHLEISARDSAKLVERTVRCPVCGYALGSVCSDTTGHLRIRCHKCKFNGIMDLSFFKIWKSNRRTKHWKERSIIR